MSRELSRAKREGSGRVRIAAAALAGLASLASASAALAEEPNFVASPVRDAFAEAKGRGDDALVSGRPAEALAAYKEAYAARPDPAIVYNIGRAHQALRDYPAALVALEKFETVAPPEVRARVPGLPTLLADVRKRVSMVAVSSDVVGATVRLDGRVLGTTPLPGPLRVNAGAPATLIVEKEGFFPFQRVATLQGGAVETFDAKLTSKQSAGIVTIRSPNAGARIAVDGKPEGTVPSDIVMTPGSHQLELSLGGYRPARNTVAVAAGERMTVDLTLSAEAPITKKWWFWTGIALVAAGATVTIIALTTERDPDNGNAGNIKTGLSGVSF